MKVKVRDTVYDGELEPVMLILTPADKECLAKMRPEATRYCSFPRGTDVKWVEKWMEAIE